MRATLDQAVRFVEVALPEPGKPFGPYVVEFPVGQGGFGVVFRARDPRLARAVALKVLHADDIRDPESVARFVREARLAAALEHPNIVRILDVGSVEGTPYIAMEWIDGTTLSRAKVERPLELLGTIAETLAFAHERGVVHRDLKPANVMIDRDGRPRIVDFGIAKRITGPATAFATRDGIVLGTPRYMAPEQELTSAVDARADQFAWGTIAYELLTGERPLRPALAHAALEERPGRVILRALSTAPSDRYPSMRELLADWKGPAPARTNQPRAAPVTGKPRSKVALILATVAVAALVASIGLVLALAARRPKPPPPPPSPVTVAPSSTSLPAPQDDAATEPPVDAQAVEIDAAAPAPSKAAPPRSPAKQQRVVRVLKTFYITGSSYVDRDELHPQMRAARPAFEKCVIGITLPLESKTLDTIDILVDFLRTGAVRVRFPEILVTPTISEKGAVGGVTPWPSNTTRNCLRDVAQKWKITPTNAQNDGFARITFELER